MAEGIRWNGTPRRWAGTERNAQAQPVKLQSNESLVRETEVYNFEVEDFHTYHAGDGAILVHNNCLGDAAITNITATEMRALPGIASGNGMQITGTWLRGSAGNAGFVPHQVANILRGQSFSSFGEFRGAFWKATSSVPELAGQFSVANRARMAQGYAPRVAMSQQVGKSRSYVLHHQTPIQHGGAVYDVDNIVVVTPRYHAEILVPSFHY